MKTLYVDLDNVLVDFRSALSSIDQATLTEYDGRYDEVPGIFSLMHPMPGAVDAFSTLAKAFDTYVLSTSPWNNPSAWSDKLLWVKEHLGQPAHKRLILTHHKNLNRGDFLIDDRIKNGVEAFEGEHIQFGTARFPDWPTVTRYLLGHAA